MCMYDGEDVRDFQVLLSKEADKTISHLTLDMFVSFKMKLIKMIDL